MWYTNLYRKKIEHQKYIVISKAVSSTRSLYASSGPKAEEVPTNNQRERGLGPCRL